MRLQDSISKFISKYFKLKYAFDIAMFLISYTLSFFVFFQSVQYSRLNGTLFFSVYFVLILLIIIFSISIFEGVVEKKKSFRAFGLVGLLVISIALSATVYYLNRINTTLGNVVINPNQQVTSEFSFVTFNNSSVESIEGMSGKRVGILSNTETSDRNQYFKAEIEKYKLNIEYVEYSSYNDLLLGLFVGEIDVASLPANYYEQYESNEGYIEYLDKTNVIHTFEIRRTESVGNTQIDVTKDPFTILILGNDGGRTDSLILATFDPVRLSVTMTSIARDLYVPIACYPNQQKDKIGHAFSVNLECAIETVQNLFEVEVNYYVVVNFKGVVEIVDALDRVWLTSPVSFVGQDSSDDRGYFTVWIPEGQFYATGEQALTFARERYAMPGGDYQRQINQQQVIEAIIDKTLNLSDANQALNVLEAAGNNVQTNMPIGQMIDLFNLSRNAIQRTSITPQFIFDIRGSRVMGYPSYTYNDTLQLPLWILVPYQGSISDLKELMFENLNINAETKNPLVASFNAAAIFFEIDYFALTYNETEIHERLPDFMPRMANNDWTLEDVNRWASQRGISIVVDPIRPGDQLFNISLVHNYIVGQSVRYGIKTSSFNTLTLKVIKQDLDCKLEQNMVYDECKYLLPNFVQEETKVTDIEKWAKDNNIVLSKVIILETDATYDKTKIGFAVKQDPASWADIRSLSSLTITIMDPNYSITIPATTSWTETIARQWVKENLIEEGNIIVNRTATLDTTLFGKVINTTPSSGNKIKFNEKLTITVYAEGYRIEDYRGLTKAELEAPGAICTLIKSCIFIDRTITGTETVGTIASQSITPDTLRVKSNLPTVDMTFEIFVAPVATP